MVAFRSNVYNIFAVIISLAEGNKFFSSLIFCPTPGAVFPFFGLQFKDS
jgi:hypothetical protein